jgi:CYTH domain-containing protein
MIQDGDEVVYKLCQKVRVAVDDPGVVKITNIYLRSDEFHALSVTPSSIVAKSRWSVVSNGMRYAVDEFKGRHTGLVLAEVELGEGEPRTSGPEFALSEVTNVNEYSGGWLATASAEALVDILSRDGVV